MPAITDPNTYPVAAAGRPFSNRARASTLNVENVVNPPQNPGPIKSSQPGRLNWWQTAAAAPSSIDPRTLIVNVYQGKCSTQSRNLNHSLTAYLVTVPVAPPMARSNTAFVVRTSPRVI